MRCALDRGRVGVTVNVTHPKGLSSGSRGGFRRFNPPPLQRGFFFCLSVYENSHGPGP